MDPTADRGKQRTDLSADLREVRTKPERAFNLGAALGLTLAVATFIFLVQNSGRTEFEWLWFDFTLPLWIALVGALVTGALLILTALAVHARRRRRIAGASGPPGGWSRRSPASRRGARRCRGGPWHRRGPSRRASAVSGN